MVGTGHATSGENISRFWAGWVVAKKSVNIISSYHILGYLPGTDRLLGGGGRWEWVDTCQRRA